MTSANEETPGSKSNKEKGYRGFWLLLSSYSLFLSQKVMYQTISTFNQLDLRSSMAW
jgi:hypothetical protein